MLPNLLELERNVLDLRFTSSGERTNSDEQIELKFRPVKQLINIYETEYEDIVLVAYVLDKILTKNELDNEGNPIIGFAERNFVDIVPKPDRSRIESCSC